MPRLRLVAAALLCAGALPAQPLRSLAKPDAEFTEPFTNLGGVRELSDGRVVAIDRRDKLVAVVDFKGGTMRKVGREGSGPKEYGLPMELLPLPGDSSMIFDPLNSRSLLILPNGEPGDFVVMQTSRSRAPAGGMMMIGMTPPRYTDARGRIYSSGGGFIMGSNGPVSSDSAPILRYDRSTKKTDTVAFVRQPKDNIQASGTDGRMSVRIGMANPFAPRDEWAVLPDGRVAILRSPEYRVDWAGSSAHGTPIAYDKVKVSAGHKQAWRDSRKNATMIAISSNNGRQSVSTGPGARGIDIPDPDNWPEFMPPFLGDGRQIVVAPNGQVWVARTRDAKDSVPTYDVIDGTGRVVMRVALPAKTRVVGFGKGTVYAARTDDDDLQYLQRFRAP